MTRICLLLSLVSVTIAADWPQWRGPTADGISQEKSIPTEWSKTKNVAWRADLPGLGTSTPIIAGERIFLTTQIGDGPFEQRSRDFDNASTPRKTGNGNVRFVVLAFSRIDGHKLWEYSFDADGELPKVHIKHNLASPSCVTDGKMVYAWMGNGQLAALTVEGKPVWKRHLGKEIAPFDVLWGHGSSPLLYKDRLILLVDHPEGGYLLSLDKTTGRDLLKVNRGKELRSYTTPLVVPGPHGDELIINSTLRVEALSAATGELLWYVGEPNRVPVPTPVFHDGILYANRGYSSSPYFAVRTGGAGDAASRIQWEAKTGGPYVSSLLYYQGLIYMANETGIASCVDATNGNLLWKERLGSVFSASPVAADGKVYLANEAGDTFVLEAGRERKILQRNTLDERTLASPAISNGQIFLRTDEHLYCIGTRKDSSK